MMPYSVRDGAICFPWLFFRTSERLDNTDNSGDILFYKTFEISGLTACLTTYENKLKIEKSRRSAAGSAQRSGRWGRGFDPRRLDQNSRITIGGTAVFDSTACDGERGWEPFCGSKTLCLTKLGLWKTWRQRTTLITSERGAPLKAQSRRLDQNPVKIKRFSRGFYFLFLLIFSIPLFFVYCVAKFEGWLLIITPPFLVNSLFYKISRIFQRYLSMFP